MGGPQSSQLRVFLRKGRRQAAQERGRGKPDVACASGPGKAWEGRAAPEVAPRVCGVHSAGERGDPVAGVDALGPTAYQQR